MYKETIHQFCAVHIISLLRATVKTLLILSHDLLIPVSRNNSVGIEPEIAFALKWRFSINEIVRKITFNEFATMSESSGTHVVK